VTSPLLALTTVPDGSARRYAARSRAASTLRAYRAAWREFEAFVIATGNHDGALPASPGVVINYLTALADRGQKVSTIDVKLAGVSFRHSSAHLADPTKDADVRAVMSGIRRTCGAPPVKKKPVLLDELRRMARACDMSALRGKRDKCLLLLGWAGAFRRSELVALDVGDLEICDTSIKVTLRRSKTDQQGAGQVKVIPQIGDKALDPVRAVKAWLGAAGIEAGPIFREIHQGGVGKARLAGQSVSLVIKRLARLAGLDPAGYSGHSLRSGFITSAVLAGASELNICAVTGHKSLTTMRGYVQDAGRGASAAVRAAFGGA
jgi:integrase